MKRHGIFIAILWLYVIQASCEHSFAAGKNELDQAFNHCAGKPNEYAARATKSWAFRSAVYWLLPEQIAPAIHIQCPSREKAQKIVSQALDDIRRGDRWTTPCANAAIPHSAGGVPLIDGNVTEKEWKHALQWQGEVPLDSEAAACGSSMWYIQYDDEYLYVGARFDDVKIFVDSRHPYQGDCLEFFICPEPELRAYWEVVVSPDNDCFAAWHSAGTYGERNSRQRVTPVGLRTAAAHTGSGYEVEMAFPFYALFSLRGRLPFPGAALRIMFCRVNRDRASGANCVSAPVPLLYSGHNIYGYIQAALQ